MQKNKKTQKTEQFEIKYEHNIKKIKTWYKNGDTETTIYKPDSNGSSYQKIYTTKKEKK